MVDFNEIQVKLIFFKTSRKGKWNVFTTNHELGFGQAYKIYSIRWSVEVFFKESKQYLMLGKCQLQDFDAQIASTIICMIPYNLLPVAKRFTYYESLGEIFISTNAETIQLTLAERLCQLIIDVLVELAELIEIDIELLMGKLISDNQRIIKSSNYAALLQVG